MTSCTLVNSVKTIEEMLRHLAKTEVSEFAIVSDRLPCIKVSGQFQPVDDAAPSTDVILQMLVGVGGSRYVDALGPKPVQWSTRLEGVGTIAVSAMMRDDIVQARFLVQRRDDRPLPPPQVAPPPPPPPPPPPSATHGRGQDFAPAAVGFVRGGTAQARPPAPPPVAMRPAHLSAPPPPTARAGGGGELDLELELDDRGPVAVAPAMNARDVELDLGSPAMPPDLAPAIETGELSIAQIDAPFGSRDNIEAPITRASGNGASLTLGELLIAARSANASDLHVIATRPPLMRIAGELLPQGNPVDAAFMERIVHAIVPPRLAAQLDADGTCDFAFTDETGRSRVNVTKQRTGYKVCIRLIPDGVPTLASLGLPDQIGKATHHHQGLILVTGPTGHGKTSTLAAIVDIINRETTHHVITVEDPVEYIHPRKKAMMSQREVGAHTPSFQAALKGSLREDPDVIVVGELRDTETVRMALSASETGHLVIGTMNTPSAAKTIDRLIDLFPPSDQAQVRMTLSGGLRLIVSQRLIPNAERTGLVAAAEILPGSISLWSLIRDNKTYQIPSLQQRGKGLGIVRLDDSLAELVRAGKTTAEIAKQNAESPDELEMVLSGKRAAMNAQYRPPEPPKPGGEAAKEAIGGLLGKAGNLFRKG